MTISKVAWMPTDTNWVLNSYSVDSTDREKYLNKPLEWNFNIKDKTYISYMMICFRVLGRQEEELSIIMVLICCSVL